MKKIKSIINGIYNWMERNPLLLILTTVTYFMMLYTGDAGGLVLSIVFILLSLGNEEEA